MEGERGRAAREGGGNWERVGRGERGAEREGGGGEREGLKGTERER